MHVKATITGKPLASALGITAREWTNLGNLLRDRVVLRTRRQHVDADLVPFHAYSEGYKRTKGKKGGLLGGGSVDLTGAGGGPKMLNDIVVRSASATTNPRLVLGFATSGKDQIARYHMGEGRVDRLFFALSDADVDYATTYIRGRLKGSA